MKALMIGLGIAVLGIKAQAETNDWNVPTHRPTMTFEVKVGSMAAVNAPFHDSDNKAVTLKRYLGKKPVILNLVYMRCPSLCTVVLNNLVQSLQGLVPTVGKTFSVVTVSIDAREKPFLAAAKRKAYVGKYGRPVREADWAFLTGEESAIQDLAQSVGFSYRYYPELDQFDHPAGLVILKPNGRISSYLLGSTYDPNELQSRLEEAAR